MSNDKTVASSTKPRWEKPELKKLGALRDIAGPDGVGLQAGPNMRSS
ncbi:hypothetical protein [Qipengyuania sphaerica]|nr:hypothetical protein [Qipengyuania sphaerica]MBX7541613.1 hypothetical protein [Qipengyuania sphaerica]